VAKTNKDRLEEWLHEVLRNQTRDGVLVLENGEEVDVILQDDCVIACSYEDEADGDGPGGPVYHAVVRLVPEDPVN
jgi:hypothetical protein